MPRWVPKSRSPERILAYGQEGTGKTRAAMEWARRIDGTVWYLDTDNTLDRMFDNPRFDLGVRERWVRGEQTDEWTREDGKMVVWDCAPVPFSGKNGWRWEVDAVKQMAARATGGDLIVVDTVGSLWVDVRAEWEDKHPKAKEQDWEQINGMYRPIKQFLIRPPCHLYMTTDATEIRKGQEEKGVKELYGRFGYKPQAQKRTGHNAQTVLYFHLGRTGEWLMSTVKDRERERLEEAEVGDWFNTYMKGVAGWKIER